MKKLTLAILILMASSFAYSGVSKVRAIHINHNLGETIGVEFEDDFAGATGVNCGNKMGYSVSGYTNNKDMLGHLLSMLLAAQAQGLDVDYAVNAACSATDYYQLVHIKVIR